MNSSYPRSDRPSLQRRPLTAPAPIRPLSSATGTATTAATVSKPHPLRRAVSHSTGPVEDEAEEGSEDDAAAAAEELREIVANLSLRQQLRRPLPDITDTGTTLPNQTESRPTAAAAALRKSSPPSSLLYMSRALPRTPSRGSRNGGVGVPLKRKASHGGSGGTGIPLSVPESVPMQVDTAAGAAAAGDELCADAKLGRRRDTPPWIGLDGKRRESSGLSSFLSLYHS